MTEFEYKTTPFRHQREIFERTRDLRGHGFFMEMGTGKSKVAIDTAAYMFLLRMIDAVLVVAPNTIHQNWITDQIPTHVPDACDSMTLAWHAKHSKTKRQREAEQTLILGHTWNAVAPIGKRRLRWLAMSYDATITPLGKKYARRFVDAFPNFLFIVDESTRVKSPSSQRAQTALAIAERCRAVRVLTGTPVANGPFDVYQQIRLIDKNWWWRHGLDTYAAFCSRFGVFREIEVTSGETKKRRRGDDAPEAMGIDPGCDASTVDSFETSFSGLNPSTYAAIAELASVGVPVAADKLEAAPTSRRVRVLAAYKDVERIHELIAPCTTRITKEDAGLDLPPKLYNRIAFELAPAQRAAYDRMRAEYMLELDSGAVITATLAMVRLLRLQQIACGYLPNPDDPDEPIMIPDADEPRLATFLDLLEDVPNKTIVWARFRVDIDRITEALGDDCVRIDGTIPNPNARATAIAKFRDPKGPQFFVANPAAIGMGITLNEASTVIYYSNSFSLEQREQSEDRCHRIGQTKPVLYFDLVAEKTVDERIVDSLREKKRLAALVTGDQYRKWLE